MYSPKISEDLIPDIYRLAKKQGRPMTKLINEVLKNHIPNGERRVITGKEVFEFLKDKRITLDCGHSASIGHSFSNTVVVYWHGEILCHNCAH